MKKIDFNNHVGRKINWLTLIKEVDPVFTSGGNKKRMVEAICECGSIKNYHMVAVLSGVTKSCGCYSRSMASINAISRNTKHGMYGTPEYECWLSIKKRCLNDNHKSYPDYGGRGIKVCERWLVFDNFLNDMGLRPDGKTSIDRKNVNGDYNLENCRWSTAKEQTRNQRNNKIIKFRGESKCLGEWCELLGLNYAKVYYRAFIAKWDVEKAFSL